MGFFKAPFSNRENSILTFLIRKYGQCGDKGGVIGGLQHKRIPG